MSPHASEAKRIFLEAVEKYTPDQWPRFLDQACERDSPLRDYVEALLKAHGQSNPMLDGTGLAPTIDMPPITEGPGTMVGRYKLIEQIGEGGMGLVFMARQREPVKRNVALKVIKPGMDTRQVIARFEAERQALALMDHPNIARVLDAGATDSGRPYFVMELVKGIPITEYCDRERLSTRKRLELFIPVCQAVQHAHQKGIIHRDIKPTNVLVTLHDGTPVPKVIDFGVAKATDREVTQETLVTRFAQVIGTPLYMSPEQAELSGLDIDTRTDVYALGVLLYELLTGTTPFEQQRFSEASYDEIRRIIREEEPPKPSTRISTLGDSLTTIAENRQTNARTLKQHVRGELDWIVMKALDKDRTRRYGSAADLAQDVQRYVDDEAVEACPPSTAYVLRKFVRRNRTVIATTAAVMFALLVGAVIAIAEAVRATKAERVAKHQTQLILQQKQLAEEAARLEGERRTLLEEELDEVEARFRMALDAVDVDPSDPSSHRFRAEFLLLLKRYDEVLSECEAGLNSTCDRSRLHSLRGQAYIAMGQYGCAHADFLDAIRSLPDNVSIVADSNSAGALATENRRSSLKSNRQSPPPQAVSPFAAAQAKADQRQWATHLGLPVEMANSIGMRFVLIPPGEFDIGSSRLSIEQLLREAGRQWWNDWYVERIVAEGPQHRVQVSEPFYLGVYEVTQSEYERLMGKMPSHFSKQGPGARNVSPEDPSRFPIDGVEWKDAVSFCNLLSEREGLRPCYDLADATVSFKNANGYRLPTEAEWEYACRAGSTGRFSFGDKESDLDEYGWSSRNSANRPHAVGQKKPNPFGLYDMHGNLWEWCTDVMGLYEPQEEVSTDPIRLGTGPYHVYRGSAYANFPETCRSAVRPNEPGQYYHNGFRVVLPVRLGERVRKAKDRPVLPPHLPRTENTP